MSSHSFLLNDIDLNKMINIGMVFIRSTCKIPYEQQINYSPIRRFLVQETFPKTLPRFVLILTERQRNQAFCVTAADWSHDHDLMNINPTHAHADKLDM